MTHQKSETEEELGGYKRHKSRPHTAGTTVRISLSTNNPIVKSWKVPKTTKFGKNKMLHI